MTKVASDVSDARGSGSSRRFVEDPDDIMKPRSNREIKQPLNTCFRLVPEQWNNVPKIVYEAMAEIISTLDKQKQRISLNNDDFKRF